MCGGGGGWGVGVGGRPATFSWVAEREGKRGKEGADGAEEEGSTRRSFQFRPGVFWMKLKGDQVGRWKMKGASELREKGSREGGEVVGGEESE